ncbi:MAG: EVE domain-containing protein [Phycisphaerales bacterium]|nr:EVE domain-containing protein [Phycisphaerales bacterium]
MTTFLLKTEPDCYNYDNLVKDKRTHWDGVRNPTALMHMRTAKKGDEAYIYHTGKERRIAGLAKIVSDVYEDPENPGLTGKGDLKGPLFDIKPIKAAKNILTLADIKADDRFKDFDLVRLSRLSAMPVPPQLDKIIRKLAGFE